MLRPLHVRRIQQRPLGARRQLAEARGEKGAQGHGARDFAAALAYTRIFVAAGGALGRQPSFIAVGVYSRVLPGAAAALCCVPPLSAAAA